MIQDDAELPFWSSDHTLSQVDVRSLDLQSMHRLVHQNYLVENPAKGILVFIFVRFELSVPVETRVGVMQENPVALLEVVDFVHSQYLVYTS